MITRNHTVLTASGERIATQQYTINRTDDAYPSKLKDGYVRSGGEPYGPERRRIFKTFYAQGNLSLLNRPWMAIIGTRHPTKLGREQTRAIASYFAKQGWVIVAGLAMGIDDEAHNAALDAGGDTIAFLYTMLAYHVPAETLPTRKRMAALPDHTLVITEYDTPPILTKSGRMYRGRPFERDWAVGCSEIVVAIEAGVGSGTLHTVGAALEYGHPVYAPRVSHEQGAILERAGLIPLIKSKQISTFDIEKLENGLFLAHLQTQLSMQ